MAELAVDKHGSVPNREVTGMMGDAIGSARLSYVYQTHKQVAECN